MFYTVTYGFFFPGTNSPNFVERSPVPLLPLVPNLDEDDDDDYFNPMPQLERYDRGDTAEITNLQSNHHPPNLLTASSRIQVVNADRRNSGIVSKRNKSKQKAKPGYGWKRGTDSSKTPKISKQFRSLASNSLNECESITEGENKCTSDLVGVTDRLKDDTGSPNQPQFEFEKRVHTQVFKAHNRSPAKKEKESETMRSKYHKKKVKSNISSDRNMTSKLDISSYNDAEETGSTLKFKNDGRTEESCSEKVSRWFRTHNNNESSLEVTPRGESPKPNSNKECSDTNNNTPTKTERTGGQIVLNTATETPNKGLLTPTRSRSTRYKPKKFFDVEGHDWSSNTSSPVRKKVGKINQTEQNQGTSQFDQSMKSENELTYVTRDPLPQRKRKKLTKQMSESEFSEEEENKKYRLAATGKRGRPSKISKCAGEQKSDVERDPSNVPGLQKGKKPKSRHVRSTKNTLESSDYESETTSDKCKTVEAESTGSLLRSPLRLEKPHQKDSTKGNGNSLEMPRCEREVKRHIAICLNKQKEKEKIEQIQPVVDIHHNPDSKLHEPGNKEGKAACTGTKNTMSAKVKSSPTSKKENNREEYTPTDDGKKRKVTCIDRCVDESGSLIKRMRQSRLTFQDTVKNEDNKPTRRSGKINRGKKRTMLRQQRVDDLINKQNSNEDESTCSLPPAADSECESVSDLSVISERRDRTEFATEAAYKAYVEEQDRLYAERLNKEYEMEEKLKLTAFRFKGSEGAYSFRRKKSTTVSENEKTAEPVRRSQRR